MEWEIQVRYVAPYRIHLQNMTKSMESARVVFDVLRLRVELTASQFQVLKKYYYL